MAARIFLTGATGYVGGEALHQLASLPQKHSIRCLVRNGAKAELVKQAYPAVETVQGDIEDASLIENEASGADVVFHLASTRHEVSSRAIIKGLSSATRKSPGHWIQIGGASMFAGPQMKAGTYGEADSKIYDDIKDAKEIREVIVASPARVIDNLIISQDASKVKTALVVGPIIYGKGSGPGNTRTIQGPAIADYALRKGQPFQIGKGASIWSSIHVSDLGTLFTLLLQAAIDGRSGLWNDDGVIFAESGSTSWSNFAGLISKAANEQGLLQSSEIQSITADQANEVMAHGAVVLGTNAQIKASKARELLQWKPQGPSLADDIPVMVKSEAEREKD